MRSAALLSSILAGIPPAVPNRRWRCRWTASRSQARLTSVDAQGKLGFDVAGKPRTLAAADLVSWGQPAELRKGPILVLADGGFLPAAVLGADKADLSVDSARLGTLKLPLDSLAGIVFRPPPHPAELDALLDRVARGQGQTDRLILDNGDELTGLIEAETLAERQAQDQRQSRAGGGCRPPRRGAGLQSGLAAAACCAGRRGLDRAQRRRPPAGRPIAVGRRLAGIDDPLRREVESGRQGPGLSHAATASGYAGRSSIFPTSGRTSIASCLTWKRSGPIRPTAT